MEFCKCLSINQGQQVSILWPHIYSNDQEINFAHESFKWSNLASNNAGVTVVIVGVKKKSSGKKKIYSEDSIAGFSIKEVVNINAYLAPAGDILIEKTSTPISDIVGMTRGNSPTDGGFLIVPKHELDVLQLTVEEKAKFIKPFYGSDEVINGLSRYCIWIDDTDIDEALKNEDISNRVNSVKNFRLESTKDATRKAASWPHRFDERKPMSKNYSIVIPIRSSENRPYLPIGLLSSDSIVSNLAFELKDAPLWYFSILASRIHLIWIATVCGRLEMRLSYTNTVGWNTYPTPPLTPQNKADLTRCAENILLAREVHFPATIADLYEVKDGENKMPENLRRAHEQNDELLERIYIGRRFKNDTERLEKLFELYTKMSAKPNAAASRKTKGQ